MDLHPLSLNLSRPSVQDLPGLAPYLWPVSAPLPLPRPLESIDHLSLAVLEIVALAAYPVSLRRLIEVGRPLTAGNEFSPVRLGPTVTSLVEKGFLLEVGEDLAVPDELAEWLSVVALQSGRARLVCEQFRKLEPWSRRLQTDSTALWRHFRYALYGGEFGQADGLATDLDRLNGQRAWSDLGRRLPNVAAILAFPAKVALQIARETVVQSLNRAFPAGHAVAAFADLVESGAATSVKDQQLLGHVLLMRKDWDAFEEFASRFDFPALEGCRKMLIGDLSALRDFHRGLMEQKFFSSYTALFLYLVGLLAAEGVEGSVVSREVRKFEMFREPFEWLMGVKTGRVHELTPALRRHLKGAPEAVRPHLSLILYWGGFRYDEFSLTARAEDYQQAGYPVFAEWLAWAAGVGVGEVPPLLGLLQAEEGWKTILASINAWTAPSRELVAAPERLIWVVDPFSTNRLVEPRLQKTSRRGVWSSGRKLVLGESFLRPPDCADGGDMKVFDAVARAGLGRLSSDLTGLQVDAALLALAGHPRVYLAGHLEFPVELVVEPVRVTVRRASGAVGYELKLEPGPVWEPSVLAQRGDPGKLRLFEFGERHVKLARMIDAGLRVPEEGEEALRETLVGLAAAGLTLASDIELAGGLEKVSSDSTLLVRMSPYGEGLAVQVRVSPLGEGGPLFVPGEGAPVVASGSSQVERDLGLEGRRWARLRELFPSLMAADFSLLSPGSCLSFLESFVGFSDPAVRFEWPEGERFAVALKLDVEDVRPRVHSQGEWFSVGSEVRVDEGLVLTLGDLLDGLREATDRFIPLSGGRYLALTEEVRRYLERLELLSVRRSARGQLQMNPLSAVVALEGQPVEGDAEWTALRSRVASLGELEFSMPSGLRASLRDYQVQGVRWMLQLAHWGVGACLADDMGLGKTVQLLTVLLARAEAGPSLVIAPTSVCWNWAEEARRFAPSLRVITRVGWSESDELLGPGDVVVVSYGTLVNSLELLSARRWGTLVLDEAQAIKNAGTQRARAACAVPAEFRVAATGTPVENHPDELWSLFKFLNPGLLGTRKGFALRFGSEAGQEALARLVRPFVLRRTKAQVLTELPPRTEILERVALSKEERAFYEGLRREALADLEGAADSADAVSVLAHLTRLRRACCHPRLVAPSSALVGSKLERCLELVEELRSNGHRALIFSQFVSLLEIVSAALKGRGFTYQYLDGSTPVAERRRSVQAFQEGEGDLFLISLKAGGTGLNLTAADYVLHLDPWWNPAVEDQASDRAHRMGQQRPVTVYRLVASDTVEEQIVELHESKRDLAARLLGGTEGGERFSADDLMSLLREG